MTDQPKRQSNDILTLHHREEKAAVYSGLEVVEALRAASKGFRGTEFATEPKGDGYVIKSVGGPVQRWIAA